MIDWFGGNKLEPVRKILRFAAQGWDKQAYCGETETRTDEILAGIDKTIIELKAVREYIETNRSPADELRDAS